MEGFGTELGIVNMLLYAVAAAFVGMYAKRIKLLLTTNWAKFIQRHKKMWAQYVKGKLEDATTEDLSAMDDEE